MPALGDIVSFVRTGRTYRGKVIALGPKGMCKVKVGDIVVSAFIDSLSLASFRQPQATEVADHQKAMESKEFDEELALTYSLAKKLNIERDDLLQWKKEMLEVESQWSVQEVGRELDIPIGLHIREHIMPALKKLKRERDEALQKAEIWAKQVEEAVRQVEASDALYRRQCEEIARMQTMASSVADVITKRDVMIDAMVETQKLLLSIQLNDIFEDTMRNHARLAIEKLAPFLP